VTIRNLLSISILGLIIGLAVAYLASLGVRLGPPDDRTNVSLQVPDINGLVVDSNVLLRGVPVGKVTAIDNAVTGATVHFYIAKPYSVPVDSEVRLENLSTLGESYIGLMPRSTDGPVFRDGQQVATGDIVLPTSISELAGSVVRVLNQLDPEQVDKIVDEVGMAIPDDKSVLPALVRASTLLRDTVRGLDGQGGEVLGNVQTLLQNAGFVGPALAEISPDLVAAAPELYGLYWASLNAAEQGGIPESARNVGRFVGRVQKFLDERAPDLKVFGEALAPNVSAIAAAAMNFDTSQILTNMLDAVPEDGTITLRVRTPNP
jgi:virulence factor Mce-like protein